MKAQRSQAAKRFPYDFSPLPKHCHIATRRLSPSGKDIYSYIVGRVDGKQKTGWTFKVSDRDMQDTFGYRRETISRARQEIQSLGLAIQLPHAHHQCRIFYIGTLEQVRWMHVALIVTFIKLAKKWEAMEAIKRLRSRHHQSQTCEQTVTSLCADGHKAVSVSSQESPAENPSTPRPQRVSSDTSQTVQESLKECIQEYSSPPTPSNVEMLFGKWNEAKGRPEMEKERFCKYLQEGIQKVRDAYSMDKAEAVNVLKVAIGINVTRNDPDTPCYFWKHSNGKKRLHDAVEIIREKQELTEETESFFDKQRLPSSNDSTITEKPTAETVQGQCSDKGSAPPAESSWPAPHRKDPPQTPLATVRRNLAGRAAMLKAGIISPLNRDDVLSHARPGLDAFDDIPGDDVIMGVWNELASAPVEPESMSPKTIKQPVPAEQPEPPKTTDAFTKLAEIQAEIVGLDEIRRSGTLSVDEIAEVTQEMNDLIRQKAMLQRGKTPGLVVDSEMSSIDDVLSTITLRAGASNGAGSVKRASSP